MKYDKENARFISDDGHIQIYPEGEGFFGVDSIEIGVGVGIEQISLKVTDIDELVTALLEVKYLAIGYRTILNGNGIEV